MNLNLNYDYFLDNTDTKYKMIKSITEPLNTKKKGRHKKNTTSLVESMKPKCKKLYKMPLEPIIITDKQEVLSEVIEIKEEPVITEDNSKLVALTFDDGPSKYTTSLLEILKATDSKATFFISGTSIRGNERVIRNIDTSGNQIGIHGYSHTPFTSMSVDDVSAEIAGTTHMLYDIGVYPSKIVRPPFGKLNESIKENVNYPFVLWNIDTEDWKSQNKKLIKDKVLKNISSGSIILMHDMYEETIEAIKELIPELQQKGYKFVTVNDMHIKYDVDLLPGKVYAKVKKNESN